MPSSQRLLRVIHVIWLGVWQFGSISLGTLRGWGKGEELGPPGMTVAKTRAVGQNFLCWFADLADVFSALPSALSSCFYL